MQKNETSISFYWEMGNNNNKRSQRVPNAVNSIAKYWMMVELQWNEKKSTFEYSQNKDVNDGWL